MFRGHVQDLSAPPGSDPGSGPSFRRDLDGLLFHVVGGLDRLCIPLSCRLDVIHSLHDEMGHSGAQRTLAKASACVYWPTMSKDIHVYCRSYHSCQVVKTDTSRKLGSLQPIPGVAPFHTFGIDFVEGLPPCSGFDSLATCTDKYTKTVRLLPCKKSDTAVQFANRYFASLFSSWGIPSVIISDRDRRFTSGFWDTLMSLAGTKLAMTTAYHLQADGQSERTNRTVEASLRIMVLESGSPHLVDFLPAVEFAHNSCVNLSTSMSPFDLLYGCALPTLAIGYAVPTSDTPWGLRSWLPLWPSAGRPRRTLCSGPSPSRNAIMTNITLPSLFYLATWPAFATISGVSWTRLPWLIRSSRWYPRFLTASRFPLGPGCMMWSPLNISADT